MKAPIVGRKAPLAGLRSQPAPAGCPRFFERMIHLLSGTEVSEYRARFRWITILFSISFLFLLGRFWWLQVLRGEHYLEQSRDNFVREYSLPADRGLIKDAQGRVVAANRPAYSVSITPYFAQDTQQTLDRLAAHLELDPPAIAKLRESIDQAKGLKRFQQLLVQRDITREQLALLETHKLELPGVHIQAAAHRFYPFNQTAAHLIGHMNEISAEELSERTGLGYRAGNYIGRKGIERQYEGLLRGQEGRERVVVNAKGIQRGQAKTRDLLGEAGRTEPVPGKDIILTVDMKLERIIEQALERFESGAVVAADPRSGRILAMVSKPSFNPNQWTGRLPREVKEQIDSNPFKPMIDKTIWSYFPGSTYKVVTALAALNEGLVTPKDEINCPGYYLFGKRLFRCWDRGGHGKVNLHQALAQSCDVYFYRMGELLGMEKLARYAQELGFGSKTGLIGNESPGLVPSKAWHERHSREGFQHGFTLSTAVGQGDTRTTPLQLTLAYGAIANGGFLYYPQLVQRIESANGETLIDYPPRIRHRLPFKPEHLHLVMDALTAVVEEEKGTAYRSRIPGIPIAGKTGTAQVRGLRRRATEGEITDKVQWQDHAWFTGISPPTNPIITVTVFLENGGSGGKNAAPVAINIIDRYYREVLGVIPGDRTAVLEDDREDDSDQAN